MGNKEEQQVQLEVQQHNLNKEEQPVQLEEKVLQQPVLLQCHHLVVKVLHNPNQVEKLLQMEGQPHSLHLMGKLLQQVVKLQSLQPELSLQPSLRGTCLTKDPEDQLFKNYKSEQFKT